MARNLVDILRHVQPAGRDGFEGLIAELLQALTGTHFKLANAGYQEGRDMNSRPQVGNVTAVECKRYGAGKKISLRELQGELVQVELAIRDLDLWVLVTSRDVDSRLAEALHALAVENGHSFLAISSADGDPSSLESLFAYSPAIALNHPSLLPIARSSEIRVLLERIASRPAFPNRIIALKEAFTSPLVGYENWRTQQNQYFLSTLKSNQQAQASYGQPLNVEDPKVKLIRRERLWVSLDKWNEEWNRQQTFAVLGEEGDGKTWGATSWLAEKIKRRPDFPGVIFLSSGDIYENEFMGGDLKPLFSRVIAQRLIGITKDQSERRFLRWTSRHDGEPLFLLVLDGLNERHSPKFWRGSWSSLVGNSGQLTFES